jgi:hypothetical protein
VRAEGGRSTRRPRGSDGVAANDGLMSWPACHDRGKGFVSGVCCRVTPVSTAAQRVVVVACAAGTDEYAHTPCRADFPLERAPVLCVYSYVDKDHLDGDPPRHRPSIPLPSLNPAARSLVHPPSVSVPPPVPGRPLPVNNPQSVTSRCRVPRPIDPAYVSYQTCASTRPAPSTNKRYDDTTERPIPITPRQPRTSPTRTLTYSAAAWSWTWTRTRSRPPGGRSACPRRGFRTRPRPRSRIPHRTRFPAGCPRVKLITLIQQQRGESLPFPFLSPCMRLPHHCHHDPHLCDTTTHKSAARHESSRLASPRLALSPLTLALTPTPGPILRPT